MRAYLMLCFTCADLVAIIHSGQQGLCVLSGSAVVCSLFIVAPIVCWGFVLGPCFVWEYFVSFLVSLYFTVL